MEMIISYTHTHTHPHTHTHTNQVPLIVDEAHGSHLSLISGMPTLVGLFCSLISLFIDLLTLMYTSGLQRSVVGCVGRWWLPGGGGERGMGALEGGAEVIFLFLFSNVLYMRLALLDKIYKIAW